MAARAIWKGNIRVGSVDVPVKLYSAVQDRSIHFRILEKRTKEPVKQQMVDPHTGEVVEHDVIQRAYEAEPGRLVVLDETELESVKPDPSRDIEILRFVPPEKLSHQWYERPYFLGPDTKGNKAYFALATALRKAEREGVARWVMRNKEYVGALRAEGDHLMLISLRHAGEVVPASALEAPEGREPSARELAMARALVEALEGELDLSAFEDQYRERVIEYAKAKARGKVKRLPTVKERRTEASLEDMLERSIAAASKRRKSA